MGDPLKDMRNIQDSIARNITLLSQPTDHDVMRQAERNAGHISLKAVSDEYNRVMLQKHHRPSKGFWSRLFGS